MGDGTTARDRLRRLLHVLPAAAAEGGVRIDDLARELGVEPATVLDDLTEVMSRGYYHPAGSADDVQIRIESDRVSVWTTGHFQRPVKLSPMEAFCVALGLRRHMLDGGGAPAALLRRIERHLTAAGIPDEPLDGFRSTDTEPDPDGVRELLVGAARERERCRIDYLKPDDPEPEPRHVHPYAVVHAEGRWYVVGWCETAEAGRAFRLDRILEARRSGGRFERNAAVDLDVFLDGGRVYGADEDVEVVVRYSPAVARWVAEWAPDTEADGDGSVLVRHRVADPGWAVRHVLGYGGEAEVVEPEHVRRMTRDTLRRAFPA